MCQLSRQALPEGLPGPAGQGEVQVGVQAGAGRLSWAELPRATRRDIELHTGTVTDVQAVQAGRNCAVALVLTTESGVVFAKGVHHSSPMRWTQDMEELINPHVHHISPRLLWRVYGEWDVLGFTHVDGRHADYMPGSRDVATVIETFTLLSETPCPDLPLKQPEHRWLAYLDDPADVHWLQGDHLLHIDPTPSNLLMGAGGAALVDWAWPTRGAGWIDPACLVIRLIEAEHTPEQAETLVEAIPAWSTASREALCMFAHANAAMWAQVAAGRLFRIARAARAWADHRAALTTKT